MQHEAAMPDAQMIAEAMAQMLKAKLAVFDAEQIVLTREEAALCLGLAEGVAELARREASHAG